jgi:hypothetical protein
MQAEEEENEHCTPARISLFFFLLLSFDEKMSNGQFSFLPSSMGTHFRFLHAYRLVEREYHS